MFKDGYVAVRHHMYYDSSPAWNTLTAQEITQKGIPTNQWLEISRDGKNYIRSDLDKIALLTYGIIIVGNDYTKEITRKTVHITKQWTIWIGENAQKVWETTKWKTQLAAAGTFSASLAIYLIYTYASKIQ